jgi:hypothetical protein
MPNEDLRRYDWLGEMILLEMPDVIVDIGDWYDMSALCSYDKGLKSFEGRRYKADIEAGREAENRSFGRIVEYNNTMTRHKKKHYRPLIIRTTGNHEHRIHRAIEKQPELEGVISTTDTHGKHLDLDIRVYPFLEPAVIDGIACSHYFVSGIMGRPVGTANLILQKHHMSSISGHSHLKDAAEGVRVDGTRMQSLVCGSFLDPDHCSGFAAPQSEALWWSGLHVLRDVHQGQYDREEFTIGRIQRMMEGSNGNAGKAP